MEAGRRGTGGPLVTCSLVEPTSLDPEPKRARPVSTLRLSQSPPALAVWSQLLLRVPVPFLRKLAQTDVSRFGVGWRFETPELAVCTRINLQRLRQTYSSPKG